MEHQPPRASDRVAGAALTTGHGAAATASAASAATATTGVTAGAHAASDDTADTIAAQATAPGRGGIAIVRISGPGVPALMPAILGADGAARVAAAPRVATGAQFLDAAGAPIDHGLALYFPAPHSYTGEFVLELHAHGGPVLVEALMRRLRELGARRAQPGEFTQRAYLNGKLDLAQAEAVATLIDAASEAAARAALRSLEGEFSHQVSALSERIGALRAWIEAAIDFSEEDIDFLSDGSVQAQLGGISDALQALQLAGRRGRALSEGLTVVIAGRPNAGKSTLLNRLAGHEAAIVTDRPGTTRDVLRERIVLDGLPLQVLDTAGLRAAGRPAGGATGDATADAAVCGTDDPIEAEGMRRAVAAMARADHILFVIDAVEDPHGAAYAAERARLPPAVPVTLVFNKVDRVEPGIGTAADVTAGAGVTTGAGAAATAELPVEPPRAELPRDAQIRLSALTGEGMEILIAHLKACAGWAGDEEARATAVAGADAGDRDGHGQRDGEGRGRTGGDGEGGAIAARARHLEALERVAVHVGRAREMLAARQAPELVAEELRLAQGCLGEIVGAEHSDELLTRIFSTFCIGK